MTWVTLLRPVGVYPAGLTVLVPVADALQWIAAGWAVAVPPAPTLDDIRRAVAEEIERRQDPRPC